MELEFTPALQFAWHRAGRIALTRAAADIAPLDLLRGLLAETEGHVARRLTDAGLDLAAWQKRYALDVGLSSEEPAEAIGPSHALRSVMTRARQEMESLTDEGSLSTDRVLSALITVADVVARELSDLGVDVGRLHSDAARDDAVVPLEESLDLTEPADLAGARRIVDAAANRGREGLRVLEDYCRFVLDDAILSRMCKELRHDFAAALVDVPGLVEHRDTPGDVGAAISTASEQQRDSLAAVLTANAKRLQEALRSVEEFGKVLDAALGARVESLRYRAYTLEKILTASLGTRTRLKDARLYALVTEGQCRASLLGTIRELIEGGVQIVQLREKHLDDRTLLARARDVRQLTRRLGAIFILNDRPDLAALAEADGVHLGQDDLPVREARKIVGPDALIGVSTHDLAQVRRAVLDGANYLGVGPTFPSTTKDFAKFPGLEFVSLVAAETSLPAFAIGGMTLENLKHALAAGARRVAVGNAFCGSEHPRLAASRFRQEIDGLDE